MAFAFSAGASTTLEIEFTAGVWTGVSAYQCFRNGPTRIRQGRPTEFDDPAAGTFTCVLWNDDGRFMPTNPGSPYYPNFVIGKRIRFKFTKAGVTYTRFFGWIQAIQPDFPSPSTIGSTVTITATDALGLLAQRKLRSNFTEVMLWRARLDSCQVDVYEAFGTTTGVNALMTNYSTDAAAQGPSVAFSSDPILTFGEDTDTSMGGVVSWSTVVSNKTLANFQASPLRITLHLKGIENVVAVSTIWYVGTFHTATGGGSSLFHLTIEENFGNNGLWVRNFDGSVRWGLIGNLRLKQWVEVRVMSNASTPTSTDFAATLMDGTAAGGGFTQAVDMRNVRAVELPGALGNFAYPVAAGGVAALGTRTGWDWQEWVTGASGRTLSTRMGHIGNTVAPLGVTFQQVGNGQAAGTNIATGEWSTRTALEVWQEMCRTVGVLPWARGRDSLALWIEPSSQYPSNGAITTIDLDADCEGSPRLTMASQDAPTRVDATFPGGTRTVVNATAEAGGVIRSRPISTVAPDGTTVQAAAQYVLSRATATGMRFSSVTVDLLAATTDHTAEMFDESTVRGGLFPTQIVTFAVPSSHFGSATYSGFVLGWTEEYEPSRCVVTLDTTPHVLTSLATSNFTGTNGSGWPLTVDLTFNTTAVNVQGNRGRVTSNTANADNYARLASPAVGNAVEVLVTVTPQDGTVKPRVSICSTTDATTGYSVALDPGGTLGLRRNQGSAVATWSFTTAALTDYKVRMRHIAGVVSVKVWAASGSEPLTWSAVYVDPSPLTGTRCLLGHTSPDTTSRSTDFDDFTMWKVN